jgi:hypothetical protein
MTFRWLPNHRDSPNTDANLQRKGTRRPCEVRRRSFVLTAAIMRDWPPHVKGIRLLFQDWGANNPGTLTRPSPAVAGEGEWSAAPSEHRWRHALNGRESVKSSMRRSFRLRKLLQHAAAHSSANVESGGTGWRDASHGDRDGRAPHQAEPRQLSALVPNQLAGPIISPTFNHTRRLDNWQRFKNAFPRHGQNDFSFGQHLSNRVGKSGRCEDGN